MRVSVHGIVTKVDVRPIGLGTATFMLTVQQDDGSTPGVYGYGKIERVPKVGDRIDYESSVGARREGSAA